MRIIPLGGAGEVGASCTILEIAGVRLLIDAGIRTSTSGRKNPLPFLEYLRSHPPDAVLVTHAHTDHTGALPLLGDYIGNACIHMTVGTLHVLEVLQLDAVRHMTDDDEFEGAEIGISYSVDDVERTIARVVPHGFRQRFCPVPGRDDIQIEFIPCGHILGAGMVLIDSEESRGLWTGDFSVAPQPTVGAVSLDILRELAEERPFDWMVCEGTYGDSQHPDREREEERLIRVLERSVRKGGKVLIPAFAVGRSQDLGVLIRRAKLAGRLADVPVYFDGMTRGVTSIYQNVAHELYPDISEPLQILDPELSIFRANGQSRAKLVSGEIEGPAIVISSSGMLMGGRSVEYAKAFAPRAKNAILITGYTDEESPGRALLNLRSGGILRLGDNSRVRVRCFVGKYGLSAHADGPQIKSVVEAVRPRRLALVHGEPQALKRLSALLRETRGRKPTKILKNGEPFVVAPNRKRWTLPPIPTNETEEIARNAQKTRLEAGGRATMPSTVAIRHLWSILIERGDRIYSEHEMCRFFLGDGYSPEEREELSRILTDHRLYFITGSSTGQRSYRPRPKEEVMEMLVERAHAYQIPVKRGDIVAFRDGSTDIFLAVAVNPEGAKEEVEAVVAQSPRRSFRREWLRVNTGLNAEKMLTGHRGLCARWLEELSREARAMSINAAEIYFHALNREDKSISVDEALEFAFPNEHDRTDTARIAVSLALAGGDAFFRLRTDGRFEARDPDEVAMRWASFRAYAYVRSLGPGASVRLNTGQKVTIRSLFSQQGFEAETEDGTVIRCNYRRVVMPDSA